MATKKCRKCGDEFEDQGDDWKKVCIDCWYERKNEESRIKFLEDSLRYWESLAKRGPEVGKLLELERRIEELDKENTRLRFDLMMNRCGFQPGRGSGIPDDLQTQIPRLIQLCHPDKHGGSQAANEVTQWLLKMRKSSR